MAERLRNFGYDIGGCEYTETAVRYAETQSGDEIDLADLVLEYDSLSDAFREKGYIGFSDFFEFRDEFNGEK